MPHHTPTKHREPARGKTSARPRSSEKGTKDTSLFDLLEKEHDMVRDMFDDISNQKSEARLELFQQLESQLKMHMEKEEQFFYPLLEQSGESLVLILKSYEEHKSARNLLGEFEELSPDHAEWEAKFLVLKHLVTDHLESEEEELFPLAKKELNNSQVRKATKSIVDFEKSVTH